MHKCAKCGKSASRAFECSDEGGCFNADEEHMLLSSCTYCSTDCFQKVFIFHLFHYSSGVIIIPSLIINQ